ncbi:MAG TPA: hypothetical protein VNK91_02340 [Burkholderiaceae bacterium]|nr:hypothetical protein [Burkholderiaceae bacterium]
MSRIKFTFAAGLALLFLGVMVGLYAPATLELIARVSVPAELAFGTYFLVTASALLGAIYVAIAGIVLPRDWGDG